MITNGQKFRISNAKDIVYNFQANLKFTTLLTFLGKEEGLWWCKTGEGKTISINPLNYVIAKED